MLRAGVGHSTNSSAERAAEEAAGRALACAGIDRPAVTLVFFTVDYLSNYQNLIEALRRTVRTDRIVGCSGAGILTGDGEIEGGPGIAVLVLDSDDIDTSPFLFHPLKEREEEAGAEIHETVGSRAGRESLLVLLPDAYNGQPRRLLQGVEEHLPFVPVVGAGSSESGMYGKTYQLCGDQMATNGLSGILLTGPFSSSIGITQGCQPVGGPMVITKAKKNLILELDNRPAFESFARVIRGPLLEDLRRALAFVFAGLPVDTRKNSVGPGEYLVRNIVGVDPQQGVLAVADEVFEGERIIFTLRDAARAREDLSQMLERQLKILGGKRPQFGLYFNCCARGTSLYGIPGIDTAYIRRALGEFPLIGFFGNFELGPLGKKNHLLAYTGVLALVTE